MRLINWLILYNLNKNKTGNWHQKVSPVWQQPFNTVCAQYKICKLQYEKIN